MGIGQGSESSLRTRLIIFGGLMAGVVSAWALGPGAQHILPRGEGLVKQAEAGVLGISAALPFSFTSERGSVERPRHRVAGIAAPTWFTPRPFGVGPIIAPTSADDLRRLYQALDYRLPAVLSGDTFVPRIYVTGLPADLPDIPEIDSRKRLFIRTVLPLVLLANEELRNRRGQLEDYVRAQRAGLELSLDDQAWLDALAQTYEVEPGDIDGLLQRVDEVPVSLALAQAIVESGWGTSRFAQQGNALFGQRTWSDAHDAIVPEGDKAVRVRAYDDLMSSVRAYMHNLNTHAAYRKLRRLRAEQRAAGKRPEGYRLAGALNSYAEIDDYADRLRQLMRANRLAELERARLQNGALVRRFVPIVDSDS
jgi:Bax protein